MLLKGLPFPLSFTVCARVRGPLTGEILRSALDRLGRRHPLLAARLAPAKDGNGGGITTENVPPIPLRIVERTADLDWVGEIERENAQAFDYHSGPLCRCVWLSGAEISDLIIVFDHLVVDGRASMLALRDLMTLLADPGWKPEALVPPMMRELIPDAMRAKILETAARFSGAPQAAFKSQFGAPPSGPMRTIPIEWNEAESATLITACKARGLTVQAALCAAFAIPFAEREPDSPVRFMECPVDLRGRLSPSPGEAVGNYISLAVIRLECTPGIHPWTIAHRAGRALAAITDEELFTNPLVMMAVADHPISRPPVDVRYDLSLSNVGRLDIPEAYGSYRLLSIHGPTMGVYLAGHRILAVATFGGRMRCTFTSRDPDAGRIVSRARELVSEMASMQERETH
ncbi:MAG: hypothetical protein WBM17_14390 [Anaerolineales bacterium]